MGLYETLAPLYDAFFPDSVAAADFLDALRPPEARQPRVLDAGCATGSHLISLGARGWAGVGIDPSAEMTAIAGKRARAAGLTGIRFIEGDMREADRLVDPGFDLLLCLGNTLPHLEGREDLAAFLGTARGLLKPRGRIVLQLLNYGHPSLVPGFIFPELRAEGQSFTRRYGPGREAGKLEFRTELRDGSGKLLHRDAVELFPIPPPLLVGELEAAGFGDCRLRAGWDRPDFNPESDLYLIVEASPAGGRAGS